MHIAGEKSYKSFIRQRGRGTIKNCALLCALAVVIELMNAVWGWFVSAHATLFLSSLSILCPPFLIVVVKHMFPFQKRHLQFMPNAFPMLEERVERDVDLR